MAHPYHHALSSVKKWGGEVDDYLPIHDWFDGSKAHFGDIRHRALRHHTEGIFMAERLFGTTITNSDGRVVMVRYIGEQHVREDLGRIPSVADWLEQIRPEGWMYGRRQSLEKELEADAAPPTVLDRPPLSPEEREDIRQRWQELKRVAGEKYQQYLCHLADEKYLQSLERQAKEKDV
jgi:hypothetical protein